MNTCLFDIFKCKFQFFVYNEFTSCCLRKIILLDQFSRDLYGNDARDYAQEPPTWEIMTLALTGGFDAGMSKGERKFFYMPIQHSVDTDDQTRRSNCSVLWRMTTSSNTPPAIRKSSPASAASPTAMPI